MIDKDNVARELVEHHFNIEPELRLVYRILAENETSPDEPIKLLEVTPATIPTGTVEVFSFGASRRTPFPVHIAEVTPEELEGLRKGPHKLPTGWDLRRAQVFERPRAAG